MKRLFVSDLHLSPENPGLVALACDFLAGQHELDELYLLGDIFNTWLGDDLIPDVFTPFIDTLRGLADDGVRISVMVGNRDFMLGERFARRVGAQRIDDPFLIDMGGRPVLLMHGDSLCIDDVSYQRYRRWVRNPCLQWLFLRLPSGLRGRISDRIKRKSAQDKRDKPAMIMDVTPSEVARVMRQNGVSLLIHGHTHRPAIHALEPGHRIVLGDWLTAPSYLSQQDDQLVLVDPRLDGGRIGLGLR